MVSLYGQLTRWVTGVVICLSGTARISQLTAAVCQQNCPPFAYNIATQNCFELLCDI